MEGGEGLPNVHITIYISKPHLVKGGQKSPKERGLWMTPCV